MKTVPCMVLIWEAEPIPNPCIVQRVLHTWAISGPYQQLWQGFQVVVLHSQWVLIISQHDLVAMVCLSHIVHFLSQAWIAKTIYSCMKVFQARLVITDSHPAVSGQRSA